MKAELNDGLPQSVKAFKELVPGEVIAARALGTYMALEQLEQYGQLRPNHGLPIDIGDLIAQLHPNLSIHHRHLESYAHGTAALLWRQEAKDGTMSYEILLHTPLDPMAARFLIGHELGHKLRKDRGDTRGGRWGMPPNPYLEHTCDEFSGYLLIPQSHLIIWQESHPVPSMDDIIEASHLFAVPPRTFLARLSQTEYPEDIAYNSE